MSVLQKTNRLLQIFLAAFLLIAFRIWHLAVQEREELLTEARKPQRRTLLQRANRGVIEDRFGTPLALNRICYNASIYYSQFSQIPSAAWKTEGGERVRTTPRKDYIHQLSEMLGEELEMDPERIEDLIYAKASLFPHVPFTLASHISEQKHYRLKALERSWPGLYAEISSERFYPLSKTASHVIGYLGAISQKEYLAASQELETLKQMVSEGEESLVERYQQMKEKAYTLSDFVGKAGIEKQYEQKLRGSFGKKTFEVDKKGNCLRELMGGKEAANGETVTLTLSAELQQFCEQLLIQDEKIREGRSIGVDPQDKVRKILKQPWIKGGAIVAIEPNSGEILALASTPRFDPNDFILLSDREEKLRRLARWQESESYLADLWDGQEVLYRERDGGEEKTPLTWEAYLQAILPLQGPLKALFKKADDLKSAIQLQEDFEALLYFANCPPQQLIETLFPQGRAASLLPESLQAADSASARKRLEALLGGLPHPGDKLFALDLCRMAVYSPAFSDELIQKRGSMKLSAYRSLVQGLQRIERETRARCRKAFHQTEFHAWRQQNQKSYLLAMRKKEEESHSYAKPYIDYLDAKERELFEEFWQKIRYPLLAAHLQQNPSLLLPETLPYFDLDLSGLSDWEALRQSAADLSGEECVQWLKTMRSFRELDRPLWGSYRFLRKKKEPLERDLAAAFYPAGGFGFARSYAFQAGAPLGSLFKLVVAYAGLEQDEEIGRFTIYDEVRFDEKRAMIVATSPDRKPYYRHHKGGRLPKSHLPHIGKVDLLSAIEQSSNPYFSLLTDFLRSPNDLLHAAILFGFGERTGVDLPGEGRGHLPDDLEVNRTGLYSFAIGQHTFLATPLQAARMLSAIGNGHTLPAPHLAKQQELLTSNSSLSSFLAKDELALLGIDFPLFAASDRRVRIEKSSAREPVRRPVPLPPKTREQLFEGMDRTVWGAKGSARPSVIKGLYANPLLLREFLSLQHQMIGKTSTAEISCLFDANPSASMQLYKHIWFGALAFPATSDLKAKEAREKPELAVIVLLRYGDGGKEAAPLAAQVIRKWRELISRRGPA